MHDEDIYYSANHYDSSIDQTLPYTSARKTATQQRSKKEVLAIQQNLNRKGYLGKNGKKLVEDGIWGENTAYAHNAYTLDVQKKTAKQKKTASDPLNTQVKQPAKSKVSQPLAHSSHVQSVLKDNTRSQQEQEDILQRAMDAKPDYLAGLRDLLNDTKPKKAPQDELLELIGYKAPESVSSSSHVQSVLKDQTLSHQEQEDRLQRAMDAIQTKADERERARKSANPLDAILYYNNDPDKSQTEREEDYMRALQHLLQPGQTESEYRQEYRYLDTIGGTVEDNKNRYLSYQKALDQKLNQSSDPLYVLERSLKRYFPDQYSQEELGQIYDRAARQIIPDGQNERDYRKPVYNEAVKAAWIQSMPTITSPTSKYTDKEWTRRVIKSRLDALDMSWWNTPTDSPDYTPNCYFWALGILTNPLTLNTHEGQNGPGFTNNQNAELINAFEAVQNGRMSPNSLVQLLEKGMKTDCQNLGFSFRKINIPISNLNLDMDTGTELADEYNGWLTEGYTEAELRNTEVGQIKFKAQQAEAKILNSLHPDETLIVLAINPTDSDNMMHFYRRAPDGTWSSKPGMQPLEYNISSPITHPEFRVFRQGKHDNYNIMAVYAIR